MQSEPAVRYYGEGRVVRLNGPWRKAKNHALLCVDGFGRVHTQCGFGGGSLGDTWTLLEEGGVTCKTCVRCLIANRRSRGEEE